MLRVRGDKGGEVPRQAVIADLPSIKRVIEAAYAVYLDRMDRPPAPVLRDYREETEAGAIWVVGDPVHALIVLVADGDSLLVDNVAVEPSAQGNGLGCLLMAFAEQRAVALGLIRITLYTNEVMTENLAFYARLGYRETARRSEHGYRRVFMEKTPGRLHPSWLMTTKSTAGASCLTCGFLAHGERWAH